MKNKKLKMKNEKLKNKNYFYTNIIVMNPNIHEYQCKLGFEVKFRDKVRSSFRFNIVQPFSSVNRLCRQTQINIIYIYIQGPGQ